MNAARHSHTATLLNNGKVLIVGGDASISNMTTALSSAELYDLTTGTFAATGNLSTSRSVHTATLLNNGNVLVAGGFTTTSVPFQGIPLASAELYNPANGTFTPTGSMSTGRRSHTATLLSNGIVLIAGGEDIGGNALASAELYNPVTGTFTLTGNMNTGRSGPTATLLSNGIVLIAGGRDPGGNDLASAELYDPATGTFTLTGNMNAALVNYTATLLNNGKVLIAGGANNISSALVNAELYDPGTGTFTLTGNMNTGRNGPTATLLNDGKVLIASGYTILNQSGANAELYDPAAGTFSLAGNMNTGRESHTATLSSTGAVLVAGGVDTISGSDLAIAELYELVAVFPANLSFTSQIVGTTSASQTVTLTNNESTALTIPSVSITGVNASDFAETGNCVGSLSAGASCSINVAFTPSAAGARTGSLTIANNLSGSPVPVPLSGTGVIGTRIASLSSSSVTFAGVVGATTAAQSTTLSNTGNTTLTISTVAVTGTNGSDFAETDTCGGSVAAGGLCTINVTFTPTATGTRTGTLSITDDATSPPSPQTIALSGMGQDFSITAATPTATVAAGQTATYSVSVSPSGGFSQAVSLNCMGAPPLSTCTVIPSLITLNGTNATSVMVTVSTTGSGVVLPEFPRKGTPRMVNFFQFAVLFSLLLILMLLTSLIRHRRETHGSVAPVFSLVLIVLAGITLVACGGGSTPRTPAGSYSLTASGTFNYGSTTLTHNVQLKLVVQ